MTTQEVLEKAREVITPPEKWCAGYTTHPTTGAHCALGALGAAIASGSAWNDVRDSYYPAVRRLAMLVDRGELATHRNHSLFRGDVGDGCVVASYNNTHSHECVLEWFDRAIEREAAA